MSQALATQPYWVDAFLRHYTECGMEKKAATLAGTTLRQVSNYKEKCIEFEAACLEAFQTATDHLESAARERAIRGTVRGVYHKGEMVGEEVVYSDTLLQFLLKGHRREKLGDKTEITGAKGGPITIAIRTFERPTVVPDHIPVITQEILVPFIQTIAAFDTPTDTAIPTLTHGDEHREAYQSDPYLDSLA